MKKIVVTGGSGGSGRYIVDELLAAGYEVLNLDVKEPVEAVAAFKVIDLVDYAAVAEAMQGYDAVVHFAANPNPDTDFVSGADRFKNNTLSTYNVFNAAAALGMQRVVWASSETVLGYPFVDVDPAYVPVDGLGELLPRNSYAMSKVVCEDLARRFYDIHGLPSVGLRLSNILYTHTNHPANYAAVPGYWADPELRKFNLWGYVDARDVATAARLALEAKNNTAESVIIAAADTIMNTPSRDLMAAVFPDVPIRDGMTDYESLLSNRPAFELLGYEPRYSWRDIIQER